MATLASAPQASTGGLYSTFMSGNLLHRHTLMCGPNTNDVVIHEEVTSSSEAESLSSANNVRFNAQVMLATCNNPGHSVEGSSSTSASVETTVRHTIYPVFAPYSDIRRNPKTPILEGIRAFSSDTEPLPDEMKPQQLCVEKPYMKKRAGLRKQRRFYNDYFIMEQLNQLLPQSAEMARQEWYRMFCFQNKESIFQRLLEDEDCARAFSPFINISMDREAELLEKLESSAAQRKLKRKKKIALRNAQSSRIRFQSLPADAREYLRRMVSSDTLLMLQNVCVQYISSGATDKKLEFTFSKEERYMCHGVAGYYRLSSKSHNARSSSLAATSHTSQVWSSNTSGPTQDGDQVIRVTVLRAKCKQEMPPLPQLSLKDYLLTGVQ